MQETTFTPSQQVALTKCVKWFNDPKKHQVFRIYGAAGTGKSFIVGEIVKRLGLKDDEVAFAAPTGKAATVLMKRFKFSNISTLCSLIYSPHTKDKLIVNDKNEIEGIDSTTSFIAKHKIDDFRLIVLDEVSMVDSYAMEDLLSHGIPVIAIGDPYQLPPINDRPIDESGADALLTEIVRQEAGNPIIALSDKIRKGGKLQYCDIDGIVTVLPYAAFNQQELLTLMKSVDQVICGLNVTRRMLNKMMRRALGYVGKYPVIGDKLICKSNEKRIFVDYNINLCNGMICRCVKEGKKVGDFLMKVGVKPDISKFKYDLISDAGIFFTNDFAYDQHWSAYMMRDGSYVPKKKILEEMKKYDKALYNSLVAEDNALKATSLGIAAITRFDYAYAISCHASQGSEFDSVLVIDESKTFRSNASRWLYTAITRAKKRLIILS